MKLFQAFSLFIFCNLIWAQTDPLPEKDQIIKEYELVVRQEKVSLGEVTSNAMTINGVTPGPTLEFNEGEFAIIHVKNEMNVETSVHWHGLILPNFQDGVPYLTTPPIKPGTTFTYKIPIKQSGTYWYHSHTMLQEQKGVLGSIVIHPKEKTLEYDKELVVVFTDWTNEKAEHIFKNLKRGNEWYQVKKGTAVPLTRVIGKGALGAQIKMWRDRMEGADIADIYYPTFLTNGKKVAEYSNFKPGEKVRLRMINASSSTYFWLDFGDVKPSLVSADGLDVEPIEKNRLLFSIAETFDFIVTIPQGKLEVIATSQDGSGHTRLHLGEGKLFSAKVIGKPDKIEMMVDMAKMDMKMGAPALKSSPKNNNPEKLKDKYGMKMNHGTMDHGNMKHEQMDHENHSSMKTMNLDRSSKESEENYSEHNSLHPQNASLSFDYTERQKYFNYNFLKAKETTAFDSELPVNKYLFNLTGNMNRYVWSINGIPVTEADYVKIEKGKVTQITLNNLTMMHHPMHLHGHFFRVINDNGDRSPLKHTVNVAPMQEVTIEFLGDTYGDWLFHCHVLYHMMGGMTRVMSYGTPRDERMKPYPEEKVLNEMDEYFSWGTADINSNFSELNYTVSNIRNVWNLSTEVGYEEDLEVDLSYNRYVNDWLRLYVGINSENEVPQTLDKFNTVGKLGFKYFTPYMFYLDVSVDHQLRPKFSVAREILLLPRFFAEGEYQLTTDFGWVNDFDGDEDILTESKWKVKGSYMLSRNFSISGNYHSRLGWGGGLSIRF